MAGTGQVQGGYRPGTGGSAHTGQIQAAGPQGRYRDIGQIQAAGTHERYKRQGHRADTGGRAHTGQI